MYLKSKNKIKGQSTLEFAILTFCIVAALVAMAVYMKRGIQGRLRQGADNIGTLYAPGATSGTTTKTLDRSSQVEVYRVPGSATLPGGETIEGKYTYRREDILGEDFQEDVDETVK